MHPLEKKAFFLLSLSIFGYLFLRAIYVPIVGDEAATFFNYVHVNQFLPGFSRFDTNNHILNSLLSIVFCNIFGNTLLPLRLANLLSALIYFGAVYAIGKRIESIIVRWSFYSALLFSTFLIEFFALSRGYGLSMSFLMASLYCLFKILEEGKSKYYLSCILFISLGTLANLTLFNTLVSIFGFIILSSVLSKNRKSQTATWVIGGFSILLLGILSLTYKAKGLLWYGSNSGFWDVTITTLADSLLGSTFYPSIAFILILSAIAALIGITIFKKGIGLELLLSPKYALIYIFLANMALTYCLTLILGVNFPKERGALYFFPLIIVAGAFAVDELTRYYKPFSIMLVSFFYFPFQFYTNANLSFSSYWPKESLPPQYYDSILQENKLATIGGGRLHKFMWGYQNLMNGGQLNMWQISNNSIYDYQIITQSDTNLFRDFYDLVEVDEQSNLCLLKRKKLSKKKAIFTKTIDDIVSSDQEFFNLSSISSDSLSNKTLQVSFEIDAKTNSPFFKVAFIAALTDSTDQQKLLAYESYPVDWIVDNLDKPISKQFIIYIPSHGKGTLNLYLWNINHSNFEFSSVKVSVFEVF